MLHFIRNWRTGTEDLGKIIRICYAWSASNAGVSFPIFERPEIKIPHMRGTVIPAIRNFLASIDAKIHLANTMLRPPLRKHDIYIMDEALKYYSTKSDLEKINAVREYFNVYFLSEMSEPNGIKLAKGFLYGNKGDNRYR